MRAARSSLILLLAASCGPTFTEEELAGEPEPADEGGDPEAPATPIPAANYAWDDLGGCSVAASASTSAGNVS